MMSAPGLYDKGAGGGGRGVGRGPRKPGDRHHQGGAGAGGSGSSSSSGGGSKPPLSFLFVVNQLGFYSTEPADIHRDMWHNVLPPRGPGAYTGELPSRVMRYQGGSVSEARGWQWQRPALRQPGACVCPARGGQRAERHGAAAVFSCNPHLPLVVVPDDPLTLPEPDLTMHALHFFHPTAPELRGVSQATTPDFASLPPGGHPLKHVAGRGASWVPGLVPRLYENPRTAAPASRGLGGELPIVLGLMAFSSAPGRADEVFLGPHALWRDRFWLRNQPPALYPSTNQEISFGFYVAVFYDPQNPAGSTPDRIRSFEWGSVIVKENPSASSSSARR